VRLVILMFYEKENTPSSLIIDFVCFCVARDQTQGTVHLRQELSH
jgi:hypothetical protein